MITGCLNIASAHAGRYANSPVVCMNMDHFLSFLGKDDSCPVIHHSRGL